MIESAADELGGKEPHPFRIMSIPDNHSEFIIEGHGWHRIFYDRVNAANSSISSSVRTGVATPATTCNATTDGSQADSNFYHDDYKLLGSADYRIVDDGPLTVSDLTSGSLTVHTLVSSIAWYNHSTPLYRTTEIFLRVYLKILESGVYSIDYEREHEVGVVVAQNGRRRIVETIGYMQFATPNDGRHIFDLRDIDMLPIADYHDIPDHEARRSAKAPIVEWEHHSSCRTEL